jgi:hypothetical protein
MTGVELVTVNGLRAEYKTLPVNQTGVPAPQPEAVKTELQFEPDGKVKTTVGVGGGSNLFRLEFSSSVAFIFNENRKQIKSMDNEILEESKTRIVHIFFIWLLFKFEIIWNKIVFEY